MKSLLTVAGGLLLGAVACSRGDKGGQGAPGASARAAAPLMLPPLPSGDPRAKPECEASRACLRGVLPDVFDISRRQELEQKALGCLGGNIERAWDLRGCLPFTFARDQRSDEFIQVSMNCGDLCPSYASLVFDLAEPVSEFQCICRGFYPVRTPGSSAYAGCAPPPPNAGGRYFAIVDVSAEKSVIVPGNPRFAELGFVEYATIDSIDGVLPSGNDALSRALDAIPRHVPAEIRMHRETPATRKELHYIGREAAEALAKLSAELDLPALAATSSACLNPDKNTTPLRSLIRLTFGGGKLASGGPAHLFRKSDCVDERVRGVTQFEEALRRAARDAKARPAGPPAACKDIENVRVFSIAREADVFELRYADWANR